MWKRPTAASIEEMSKADVILTQAASLLKDGSLGPGNIILANIVRELHKKFPEKPIIPQEELSLAAPELPYFAIVKRPRKGTIQRSNSAWNTEAIVAFQAVICKKHSWKKAILVAEPDHQIRTIMAMKRHNLIALVAPVPQDQELYFHPQCLYWSQRGRRWRFLLREFVVRIYFLLSSRL